MSRVFTLQTLLESQPHPLLIVDVGLHLAAANKALETALGHPAAKLVGQACCALDAEPQPHCRHRRFFQDLEPYTTTVPLAGGLAAVAQVQGFPLLDTDGRLFLAEAVRPIGRTVTDDLMLGRSPGFQKIREELLRLAASDVPILLRGETGVGKEVAAEFVHRHSPRKRGPFVVVDCTAIAEDLFESELFGHQKGAFTGALNDKTGLFEMADGGTLFLDEIGELPLSQQPKLLRALETGRFRPVGGTRQHQAQVRVVSATHRDLRALIAEGGFRQDLYYRLAVAPVEIPPLRERREDIPVIADHLLAAIAHGLGRPLRIDAEAARKLLNYSYPGNVRELRNLLHLAASLSTDGIVRADLIRLPEATGGGAGPVLEQLRTLPGLSPLEAAEAGQILELMQSLGGNRRRVAAALGVSERTLYRKLKRYGLNRTAYADPTTT